MKLSIVIPVYNIRDYIVQCLESCLVAERLQDYEIILVDDGTKDDSIELVKPYIDQYANISLIKRENGGLSAARNTGLDAARGKYVWFVDGDDFLADDAISKVLNTIEKCSFDILVLGYNSVENGQIVSTDVFKREGWDGMIDGKEAIVNGIGNFPMLVWTHVYSTDFLKRNSLKFCEGILHEDLEFKFKSFYQAHAITFLHEALYNYRISRTGSIMANVQKNPDKSIKSYAVIVNNFIEDSERLNVPIGTRKAHITILALMALMLIFSQTNDVIDRYKSDVRYYISILKKSNVFRWRLFAKLCEFVPKNIIRKIVISQSKNQ